MANNLIAPNGKPSNLSAEQYALVRTPEFKAWFGDWENDPENASKIVDENGEPMVVYHSTNNDFTIFSDGFIFFSKDVIGRFGNKVLKCFLSIKNPYTLNDAQSWQNIGLSYSDSRWEEMYEDLSELETIYIEDVCVWAKKEKYNGVIAKNIGETEDSSIMTDDYIAFEPTQIKLADGSNTTFDAANRDMRYADGGKTGQEITCVNCGWHWNTRDSDESDKYVCHKCGFDNKAFYDPEPIGVMAGGGAVDILKKNIFYHGSNTLFKNIKFLESIYREDLYLGDGIYITNDINVAKKYGKYIYEIIIEEPLKSLNYSSAVSREDMIEIIDIFKNSDDADLNYLATEYQDDLDDDDLLWGKQLIADLERNGVDVYNTLLDLGYNSIVSPINKLNDFFGFDDNSMNINVIKKGILHIYSIQYEDVILQNPLDTGMRKWEKKKGIVLRDKENTITLIAYNTGNQETGTALYNKELIYKSVPPIRQANEIIEMLDNQQYEEFDESKIEDYKKSGHLIILNQNEVVYDSEKPNLSYADGGSVGDFKKVKKNYLGIDESFEDVEYRYKDAAIRFNGIDNLWILTMQHDGKPEKTIGGYKTLKIAKEVGLYYLKNPKLYADGGNVSFNDANYGHPKVSMSDIPFIHETSKDISEKILNNGFIVGTNQNITKGVYTIPIVYKKEPFNKNHVELSIFLKPNSKIFWTNSKRPMDFYYGIGNQFFENLFLNLGGKKDDYNRVEFLRNFEKWLLENNYCGVQQGGEIVITDLSCIDTIELFDRNVRYADGGLIAPNGNPSNLTAQQYKLVRTPEFKAWFGDWENDPQNASKVVDENGEPLVVYHGTNYGRFNVFDNEKTLDNTFYFTDDKSYAIRYSYDNPNFGKPTINSYVFEVFLNLKKPLIGYSTNFKDYGNNDGAILTNGRYLVLNPNQIKLADGSNTTFDASNPDISYADGGVAEFNKKNQDRVKEIKEDYKYDGSEKDLSYVNSNVAVSYLQYLADSIGAKYYQWDFHNESKMPTNHFQIDMELEGGNILSALFVYVDDNHRVVKSKSNVKLLDEDYNTIKVLVEEPKFKSSMSEYSFEYKGITFEINRFGSKWMFFGKYFGYLQQIPQLEAKSKNELIIKIKRYLDVVLEYKEKDDFADGGEVGLTEIAQDVYISKDKDKLPKDATIVIHRYNDNIKAGELGLFAGNLEDMELDDGYGKNKAYISIGKNAKLKKIVSTERYLEELGEFDKPRKYIQDKYGRDSLFDLMDDAGSLDNPSDAWYETQKLAISKMRKAGEDFEVLEMINEEDYIPHQYLITTLKDEYLQFKKGGKVSASKTPAPKKDRVFGSDKNKVGSAASKESAKKINLSEDIITTLSNKAKEYNKENSGNKVTLNTLKAVMRRGMGAYSTSHRPTITGGAPNSRQAWGFARVNKFLKKKSGEKVKAAYVQDDDLLEMGGTINKNNLKMIQQHYHSMKPIEDIQVGDVYVIKEDMFAPHQDHEHPQHLSTRYATVEVKSPCHRNLDSYTLEVMDCDCDNAAGRYAKGKVIERSRKHILSSGKLKSAVAKTTEFKDGGELNADSQEVKEYFAHDSGNAGGLLVGKRHSEGGIKADVKSTGQRIEMEGGEAVITRGAVNSKKRYVYEGKEMTTREILSDLNVKGGGVAFADGGDVPEKMNCGCSTMKVGGINYTPQDFITLSEKEYQEHRLIDGIEKERTDHFYTLAKLNSGAISIEQALREIASKEMMIDPKYPYSE